jgi:AraC-like DNA-binding protein
LKVLQVAPADTALPVGTTMALPAVLRALGADPSRLLEEVGLSLSLFDSPGNTFTFASRGRLLAHCVERTGCQHLGLMIGERSNLSSLGLVGLLARYSPDVGTALNSLVRYLHHYTRGATTTLIVEGQLVILDYKIHQAATEGTDQVGDGAVAIMVNIMRELCGPEWTPSQVMFAHRKPESVEPFRRFFRSPLRFDAEQNAIVFLADWLSLRLPEVSPDLRHLLKEQINLIEARHRNDFPEQVRIVLRTALLTDRTSAEDIAAVFSIQSRTLNRRLSEFGLSFRDLVEQQRYEIARQALTDTAMDVYDIAALLGYADASAFTRAFRRWSGTTPAAWRSTKRRAVRGKT